MVHLGSLRRPQSAPPVLVAIGLLLPAVGMLQLRRRVDPSERAARYGFAMQAFGLLGLLFAVVLVVVVVFALGLPHERYLGCNSGRVSDCRGGSFAKTLHLDSKTRGVAYLIFGTGLIFSGVGLIVGSNIAYQYSILNWKIQSMLT